MGDTPKNKVIDLLALRKRLERGKVKTELIDEICKSSDQVYNLSLTLKKIETLCGQDNICISGGMTPMIKAYELFLDCWNDFTTTTIEEEK